MDEQELRALIDELRDLPKETEWVEFKLNYAEPQEIGEYISALSNGACLHNQQFGYLIFGIEDETHEARGTNFKPRQAKTGNEELENWLIRLLDPRIDFRIYEFDYDNLPVVIFEIDAARNIPVKFSGEAFVRVGSYKKKLKEHPEKERRIWQKKINEDWSAQICQQASSADLSPEAILKAREEYKQKHPHLAKDIDAWDDVAFLNKARLTIQGQITNSAVILLGKEESVHFLSPSVAEISWILKDEHGVEQDYAHFGPPFILNIEKVFAKIRNITIRHLPDGSLFPKEISQYDSWVIREALHNCIAHQDYTLKGRINIVESPEGLVFSNVGSFMPGSIEQVIRQDAPSEVYRNPFLSRVMVALNMIDTIGSGIKRMFLTQKNRFFPLPDFNLSTPERVIVRIHGKILDEKYTRLLVGKTDLDLSTVILLDKVQKNIRLPKEDNLLLKKQGLIEGKYPNVYISAGLAAVTGQKARYIKTRGLDDNHYIELIMEYLRKYDHATRKDINELLVDKLPDILSTEQKMHKINRLLSEIMRKRLHLIRNMGTDRTSKWVLTDRGK
ncbi:MAG: putative DNA binding domain-containing protein [Nitrospirae bacterium]|nr:putative DNA binding domain-containing protein [Nitrospirota bacterium]